MKLTFRAEINLKEETEQLVILNHSVNWKSENSVIIQYWAI